MKINKQFAPITILLETQEDRTDIMNILHAAHREESKFRYLTTSNSVFQQKIQDLLNMLK